MRTETAQALDQFLRLGARLGRIAGGVGGVQLDRPPRHHIVAFLEEDGKALLHLNAAGGEWPGLDGEKADADRACLGMHGWRVEGR